MNRAISTNDFTENFVNMTEGLGLSTVAEAEIFLRGCRPTINLVSMRVSKALKEIDLFKDNLETSNKDIKLVVWLIKNTFNEIVFGKLHEKLSGMKRLEDIRRVMCDDNVNKIFELLNSAAAATNKYYECLSKRDEEGSDYWDGILNGIDEEEKSIIDSVAMKYYKLKKEDKII